MDIKGMEIWGDVDEFQDAYEIGRTQHACLRFYMMPTPPVYNEGYTSSKENRGDVDQYLLH